MKTIFTSVRIYAFLLFLAIIIGLPKNSFAFEKKAIAPSITLSTETTPNINALPSSTNNNVYTLKMVNGSEAFVLNELKVTLAGAFDADDIQQLSISYGNGATNTPFGFGVALNGAGVLPGAQQTFSGSLNIAANSTTYFSVRISLSATASENNTISINGGANPFVMLSTGNTLSTTDNQTNISGIITIKLNKVILTTLPIAAKSVSQGTFNENIYVLKVDNGESFNEISSITFTSTGTYNVADISSVNIRSTTFSDLSGISQKGTGNVAISGTSKIITLSSNIFLLGNTTSYIVVSIVVAKAAGDGNTIKIDGSGGGISLGFAGTSSPIITNNQTNIANEITLLAPKLTIDTEPLAASTILQGTGNKPAYIFKLTTGNIAFQANSLTFTTAGTYANNDVTRFDLFANTTPSWVGATGLGSIGNNTGAGSTFTFPNLNSFLIPQNSFRYFLIIPSVGVTSTPGHTIKINGFTNPVTIGSINTTPVITNNQTDLAEPQTITGSVVTVPVVTISSEPISSSDIFPSTTLKAIYCAKLVSDTNLRMTSFSFNTSGTYDNNDIEKFDLYKSSNPVFLPSTAILIKSIFGIYGNNPTIGSGQINEILTASVPYYLYFVPKTIASSTIGNTIKIDGSANPILLNFENINPSYVISPFYVNNQTDNGGTHTIIGPVYNLTTQPLAAKNVNANTTGNILQILKVTTGFVTGYLNNVSFTTSGTYDTDDVSSFRVEIGTDPNTNAGATFIGQIFNGAKSSGSTYEFGSGSPSLFTLNSNSTYYLYITTSLASNATAGNTISINGGTNPISIGSTSYPSTSVNNQSDLAMGLIIGAPQFTFTSEPLLPRFVDKGETIVPIYLAKIQSGVVGGNITQLSIKTNGTYTTGDIANFKLFKSLTPNLVNATLLATDATSTGNGENVDFTIDNQILVGNSNMYLIMTADIGAAAIINSTINVNGAAIPSPISLVVNGVAPIITNNQTNIAGFRTVAEPFFQIMGTTGFTSTTSSAYVSLVKNGEIFKTSTITAGTYNLGSVFDGVYEVVLHKTLGGSVVPQLPDGYNAFLGEGLTGWPNDAVADGKFSITVTGDNIAPTAKRMVELSINFTLSSAPLPLSLLSFTATTKVNGNELTWKTASESDFSHFEVQKSPDGKEFGMIEKVSGGKSFYSIMDENPFEGNNYYRLKMEDLDGSFSYSKIVQVKKEASNGQISLYPNPGKDVVTIEISDKNIIGTALKIYDGMGRLLFTKTIENTTTSLNISQLPSAGYYYLVFANGKSVRFLKQS